MVLSSPKEGLTFGGLSQGQNLKRAAPGEGMLLGALRMEFGEGSSRGGAAEDGSGILPTSQLEIPNRRHFNFSCIQ